MNESRQINFLDITCMEEFTISSLLTKWDYIYVKSQNGAVCQIGRGDRDLSNGSFSPVNAECISQLQEYFSGKRRVFTIPISVSGSNFSIEVLKTLQNIPYGETISYQNLALRAGFPGASRAVGTVMRKNKLPLLIPCHRVVRANGAIGRYSLGDQMKADLLNLEKEFRRL